MLAKHSSQYITIHHNAMSRGVVPTRRLTWSEDVWQCLTVSNVSDKCLAWFAQPSTLILCRRHHWWSRTFCCPVASDICINSTGVDTSRETLRSQCQGESVTCDPKLARLVFWCLLTSYGVIAASTWMNKNAKKNLQWTYDQCHYAGLCWRLGNRTCVLAIWGGVGRGGVITFMCTCTLQYGDATLWDRL